MFRNIYIGDAIVKVNEEDLADTTHEDALKLLQVDQLINLRVGNGYKRYKVKTSNAITSNARTSKTLKVSKLKTSYVKTSKYSKRPF